MRKGYGTGRISITDPMPLRKFLNLSQNFDFIDFSPIISPPQDHLIFLAHNLDHQQVPDQDLDPGQDLDIIMDAAKAMDQR